MQWVGEITEQHLPQKRLLRSLSVTRKTSVVLSQDIAVFKTIALQVNSSLPSHYQQKKKRRGKNSDHPIRVTSVNKNICQGVSAHCSTQIFTNISK